MAVEHNSFIPYGRQTISESDIAAVVKVLRSPFLTQGPVIPAFEHAVATKVGASFGVAVNSATSALHIACLALGLKQDDWLWTSPISFVASANCGLYCGAHVDFVDIDPLSGLMSVDALKVKLELAERDGLLPKVLVPVHLTGSSCDMAEIGALSDRYGFSVLEDASHAIGGTYRGQHVGNCSYSSISVFSFHPVKIITTGEGGLATTNDPILYQRMLELRSHGIVRDPERFESQPVSPWTYEQQRLGFNYRITDIQAALGLSQLKRLDQIVDERNSLYTVYKNLLSGLPLSMLSVPCDVKSSMHLGVILLSKSSVEMHRTLFMALRDNSIGVQLHYMPIHLHPFYRQFGFKEGQFPEAEAYACCAMSLPLYPGLSKYDQSRVVDVIKNFSFS